MMVKSLRLYSQQQLRSRVRSQLRSHGRSQEAWALRHLAALDAAERVEQPILAVTHAIAVTVNHYEAMYGRVDYLVAEAVGHMLEAARGMLNFDLGRLDGGTIDEWMMYVADTIQYDMDTSEYVGS